MVGYPRCPTEPSRCSAVLVLSPSSGMGLSSIVFAANNWAITCRVLLPLTNTRQDLIRVVFSESVVLFTILSSRPVLKIGKCQDTEWSCKERSVSTRTPSKDLQYPRSQYLPPKLQAMPMVQMIVIVQKNTKTANQSHLPSSHPVRHLCSHSLQSNSGLPSFLLTSLCALHSQVPKSSRDRARTGSRRM